MGVALVGWPGLGCAKGSPDQGQVETALDGGNWNHIDHQARLHFQGRHIEVVECGNMHDEGIEPIYDGSTSPKTPFNYIEFQGTGTLKGIKGNKDDYGEVCFYARAEDRSEPGSKETLGSAFIDRYWIRVDDCAGTELYRFGYDYPNPTTICADDSFACTDTIAITGIYKFILVVAIAIRLMTLDYERWSKEGREVIPPFFTLLFC